jgi:transcriptional regulator with GAF, ATPase, and Fis domain
MDKKAGFSDLLQFFRAKPQGLPGAPEYNAAFCEILVAASSAEEASIWQLDGQNQLHPVYGTNFTSEEVKDLLLREGEGIGGAVIMSRQTMAVSQTLKNHRHDRRVDRRIGFKTRSMISAPILFGDQLYGVVNILNHISGKAFSKEWEERLSIVGVLYAAALAAAGRLHLKDASSIGNDVDHGKGIHFPEGRTILVGASLPIKEVLDLCVKAAETEMPVLIRGETGTGKELAARRIHEAGKRHSGPFVEVNCAALTETLLESELFGHVKGAFSGATRNRQGKFLAAEGGTLFLDEIGDMSLTFQAKILRVIQEKKISPVGSEKTRTCDVRFVAATNQDLWEKVQKGTFREDLFYRLCGIEILMPPLRDRREDIPLLARYFLNRAYSEQGRSNLSYQRPEISRETLEILLSHSWPGNVRQLEQAVLAALTVCETDEIQLRDFPPWFQIATDPHKVKPRFHQTPRSDRRFEEVSSLKRPTTYSAQERSLYLKALDETKYKGTGRWNASAAARQLGIPRKTLIYRLKKMQIIR